jgi:hypothetical protein
MADFNIVRTNEPMPKEEVLVGIRHFLFECIKGATEDDEKRWRKLWKTILNLESGEILEVMFKFIRNWKFHKKFFALLNYGFECWEPERKHKTYKGRPVEKNIDQFREDITIAAGFYIQTFDMEGRMKLKAKSISFASMDDVEFEKVYSAVANVLLETVFEKYKDRAELDEVMAQLSGFLR